MLNRYDGPLPKTQTSAPSALEPGDNTESASPVSTPRFSPRLRVSAVNPPSAITPPAEVK